MRTFTLKTFEAELLFVFAVRCFTFGNSPTRGLQYSRVRFVVVVPERNRHAENEKSSTVIGRVVTFVANRTIEFNYYTYAGTK